MGAIKNNLDLFPSQQAFDQGESFGRYAERQRLLPVLKGALSRIEDHLTPTGITPTVVERLIEVIADIERPPAPPVTTTPTDDESVNF